MTDLVERYLASVERRLPKETAKDIVAELRDALAGRIEAKEAELGRAASADEVAAVLKGFGHPVVVASKYAGQDYVIGPNYYPWFWHVQRIAVGAAVAIAFGISAIRALGSEEPMRAVMRGINGAVEAGVWAFGVVTILFILAERFRLDMTWADKWDPKSLPREHVRQPKGLVETAFTLVFDVIFLLWWVKIVQFPNELPMREGASAAIAFSPAWDAVWWPVLVLAVGVTLVHLADLVRPAWSPLRSVLSIIGHAWGIGVLWVLYRAQPLIVVTPVSGADVEEVERVFRIIESIVNVSMGVAALVWAVSIGVEVWRLWRSARPGAAVAA
jgi:hypothetical protein